MTRILLVDDHTLFRSGIRALLASQEDIDIVSEAGEGSEGQSGRPAQPLAVNSRASPGYKNHEGPHSPFISSTKIWRLSWAC